MTDPAGDTSGPTAGTESAKPVPAHAPLAPGRSMGGSSEVPGPRQLLGHIRCPAASAPRGQPRCPKAAGEKADTASSTYVACSGQLLPYPSSCPCSHGSTEGLMGQIAGRCWPHWTPSGCRSSSWKSSVVVRGPLDMALVVMVQPVCTQTGTFCVFVFCAGHRGFRQRLAKGMS